MDAALVSLLLSLGMFSSGEPASEYVQTLSEGDKTELVEVLQATLESQQSSQDFASSFAGRDWIE
jgi:hypothetical protein